MVIPIRQKKRGKGYWTHWFSCSQFACGLRLDKRGKILDATPVIRQFIGQPLANLRGWVEDKNWTPLVIKKF